MAYKLSAYVEPHYPLKKPLLIRSAEAALVTANVKGKVELSISIIGDRKMRKLNKEYKGVDAPTDVLAFSYSLDSDQKEFSVPGAKYLNFGDVAISYPQLLDRAAKEEMLVDEMAMVLVIHGVLHLLGLDHEKGDEAEKMEALEDKILSTLRPAPEIIK